MKPQSSSRSGKALNALAASHPNTRESAPEAVDHSASVSRANTNPAVPANPKDPADYPRRVLLCVTGLSPQIVTETLYALAVNPGPDTLSWAPTELRVLTTREGAEHARLLLFASDRDWFGRLVRDYPDAAFEALRFGPEDIEIIQSSDGAPIDDILTETDNRASADAITETVRRFTDDTECALHVSIAGGRKTMGFYAGYALSLYGRAQDRLSHVLISSPFESSWDFFYPTPYPRTIESRQTNRPIDAKDAEVSLADIPFVRLRHGLPRDLREGRASFSAAVGKVQENLGPPELVIDLKRRRIRAAGKLISLTPADLALLAVFAKRAQTNEPALPAPNKHVKESEWASRFLAEYRAIRGEMADTDATDEALKKGQSFIGQFF